MQNRVFHLIAITLASVVIATSCSSTTVPSGDGGADVAAGTEAADPGTAAWIEGLDATSFSPDVVATVDALIATHGDDALLVMLYAFERGYSFQQLSEGARGALVQGDGTFIDGTAPQGAAAGVVLLPSNDGDGEGASGTRIVGTDLVLQPAVVRTQPLDGRGRVEQLRRATAFGLSSGDIPGRVLELVVAGLARDGYSLEQITDAIVLGVGVPFPTADFDERHLCLLDTNGVLIKPAVAIGDNPICFDRTIAPGPFTTDEAASDGEAAPDSGAAAGQGDAAASTVGTVAFVGTATQGVAGDDLVTATFEVLIDGDNVVMVADYSEHIWIKGGLTDPPFEDQNCGATLQMQLRGEGLAGSPTTIGLVVVSNELVDWHGAICFNRAAGSSVETPIDESFYLRDPGASYGRFEGQANGLGVDGLLRDLLIQANVPN